MQWTDGGQGQAFLLNSLLGKKVIAFKISGNQTLVLEFEDEMYLECLRDLENDFESIMITGSDNSWIVF